MFVMSIFLIDYYIIFQFTQHIKIMEKEDQEIARLAQLVKNYFIPPMNLAPSGNPHYRH